MSIVDSAGPVMVALPTGRHHERGKVVRPSNRQHRTAGRSGPELLFSRSTGLGYAPGVSRRALPPKIRLAAIACALLATGCVSRRVTIRSNPPGALVEVDGERLGFTPVSFDFDYYATREITLSKVGYETLTVKQPFKAPWYQIPPLDAVSDNLLPYRVTNRHDFAYTLTRQRVESTPQLIERASNIRSRVQSGQ